MATNDNTEADSSTDVLLTEEDILAFFLSKSGEVKNSELVAHFRRPLKTGQHRRTNRQQFPQIINRLATARTDADGRKILTLKKKFRHPEVAAAATGMDTTDDVANGESAAAAAAAKASDDVPRNQSSDERTASQAPDSETMDSKQEDVSELVKNANREKEQSSVDDATSKTPDDTNDDSRNEQSLADDEQEIFYDAVESTSIDETRPATEDTAADCNIVDGGSVVSSTPTTDKTNTEQLSLEDNSHDNGTVEEVQPTTKVTVAGGHIVDDGSGVLSTALIHETKTEKLSADDKSHGNGNIDETRTATGDTVAELDNNIEEGSVVPHTVTTKTYKAETLPLDDKPYDNGNGEETQRATEEKVTGDNIVETSCSPVSSDTKAVENKSSVEGTSYENGSVEQAEPDTVAGGALVDGDPGVSCTPRTKKKKTEKLSVEDSGNVEETHTEETMAGDNAVDDGSGVSSTPSAKKKAEKTLSQEGRSYGNGKVEETQPAADETATGDDVFDGGPDVPSADGTKLQTAETKQPAVVIVVDDQSSGEPIDEVDSRHQGVRELAERIDKAADMPVTMRAKKQVHLEEPIRKTQTGRPPSTPYDYTMNEVQREWTLRASYSDYQALAKLLNQHKGNDVIFFHSNLNGHY